MTEKIETLQEGVQREMIQACSKNQTTVANNSFVFAERSDLCNVLYMRYLSKQNLLVPFVARYYRSTLKSSPTGAGFCDLIFAKLLALAKNN